MKCKHEYHLVGYDTNPLTKRIVVILYCRNCGIAIRNKEQ